MQAMHSTDEHEQTEHPLVRIATLGEFALARLVRAPSGTEDVPPRYMRIARNEWSNRGPAIALLKVLLCRADRWASRDELVEAIWPDHEAINAAHALGSAAPVLRRHILRAGEIGSLLHTLRSGGETIFKLAGQQCLWVDADAYALARGEFLEDDLYLKDERVGLAEELLLSALEEEPTDEDALCRLMLLLAEQERPQEALQLYQYTQDVLQEEQAVPAVHTREPARRIQQGLILRERRGRYTAVQAHIPSLAGLHRASTEQANSFDVE